MVKHSRNSLIDFKIYHSPFFTYLYVYRIISTKINTWWLKYREINIQHLVWCFGVAISVVWPARPWITLSCNLKVTNPFSNGLWSKRIIITCGFKYPLLGARAGTYVDAPLYQLGQLSCWYRYKPTENTAHRWPQHNRFLSQQLPFKVSVSYGDYVSCSQIEHVRRTHPYGSIFVFRMDMEA